MGIVAAEREIYEGMWSSVPAYGRIAPGEDVVPFFLDMTQATRGTVLDAGCGTGRGALALQAAGLDPVLCDMTREGLTEDASRLPFREACLWHLTPAEHGRFDYVYCCDVMEHIPTEYTMLTLARLLSLARKGLFLSIALVPDHFGIWIGANLHRTVQPFGWWRDRLRDLGQLVECRDLLVNGVYLVRGR